MEITTADIIKWRQELNKKNIKGRENIFTLPQGHIGNGVYRIANGFLTNKSGWDEYINLLKEKLK